jgi:methyl-accepting chemotaxis protein
MFRLPGGGGGTQLSTVSLRDATPKRLAGPADDSLDFDAAIKAHRDWKQRLLSYVAGTSKEELDPAVVSCDDKCALGKWIYGTCKPAMGGDRRCENLVTSHASFHKSAGEIIRRKLAGDAKTATQVLKGDFARYSNETVRHIEIMRMAWRSGARGTAATAKAATAAPAQLGAAEDEWQEF